jgi:hypothetical protein
MSTLDNLFIDLINATGDLATADTHHVEELKRIHRLLLDIRNLTHTGELPHWDLIYPAIKPDYAAAFTKIHMLHIIQGSVNGLIHVAQTELKDEKPELLADLLDQLLNDA